MFNFFLEIKHTLIWGATQLHVLKAIFLYLSAIGVRHRDTLIVAYYFPPAAFGKFIIIAQGATSGGVGAAVAGRNVLEGAVQGALFAGFGQFLEAKVIGQMTGEILKAGMAAGLTGALQTAINGGNFVQNVLLSAGSAAAAQFIVPNTAGVNNPALKRDVATEMQKGFARSAVTAGITVMVDKKSNLAQNLTNAAVGGLQAAMGAAGHNRRVEAYATASSGYTAGDEPKSDAIKTRSAKNLQAAASTKVAIATSSGNSRNSVMHSHNSTISSNSKNQPATLNSKPNQAKERTVAENCKKPRCS